MDTVSPIERSRIMASVKSNGNKSTEVAIISCFRKARITGWRRHYRLNGKPDFVFPKLRLAVFVDGCFWHACPQHATKPRSHAAFWRKKLARNQTRDQLVTRMLRQKGWRVLRIWEHELARKNEGRLLRRMARAFSP
jgi:DNA mismatch endonuclease (patch repair protein)